MTKEIALPTIAELTADPEAAFKNDQLNLWLNQEPPSSWVKVHPYIKGYKYLPIDKVELMLKRVFKQYRIEITGQGSAFNGVWVTVRLHYQNPTNGEWSFHDGIGAAQMQTKAGTSPADLININNGALGMAFPIAKTLAVKDAADMFGKVFGADLNRKDTLSYNADPNLSLDWDGLYELFVLKRDELSEKDLADCKRVIENKEAPSYNKCLKLLKSK